MIPPVTQALENVLSLVRPPLATETIPPLAQAAGRTLAATVTATRMQPPFAASAMDGYALNGGVEADPPEAQFMVIGESAAGDGFDGRVGPPGQCVRIFTGAPPLPEGTDRVVIQEDVERQGNLITLGRKLDKGGPHVRPPAGDDFAPGDTLDAPPAC